MMLDILILLFFGKMQDQFADNSSTWQWAAAYAVIQAVAAAATGTPLAAAVIGAAILFLYAWGYFALLRRLTDSIVLWLAVLLIGALAPLLLAFVPASSATA